MPELAHRTSELKVLIPKAEGALRKPENDDFAVRRFYVAFTGSVASERKGVLASCLAGPSGGLAAKESPDDTTKREFEVIKELVQALSKKL